MVSNDIRRLFKCLFLRIVLNYVNYCIHTVSKLVYPSLESDEEDLANKAKMKRKKNWEDTPWSPKGSRRACASCWIFSRNDY